MFSVGKNNKKLKMFKNISVSINIQVHAASGAKYNRPRKSVPSQIQHETTLLTFRDLDDLTNSYL